MRVDGSVMFDIYEIENQQANLLNRIPVGNQAQYFNMTENKVFFTLGNPYQVAVYDIIGDNISLVGTFNGSMQLPYAFLPSDYILTLSGSRIIIRDINNHTNILFERTINVISHGTFVMPLDDNHFVLANHSFGTSHVYYYCIANNELNQLSVVQNSMVNAFNGVLSSHRSRIDTGTNRRNEYFSIVDNKLVEAGVESFPRIVNYSFFFPERGKMVQVTTSGIWVYDFEYTVSEYDISVPQPMTKLLGNYPNPFNPETTISFVVGGSRFENPPYPPLKRGESGVPVQLEVYNIRGQRVRTLLDGSREFGAGEHSVVWDGRDESGGQVSSGVYFYRMRAGEYVETRRMVLLK